MNEVIRYFTSVSPREAAITKIEFEGTRLAIYTKNQDLFMEQDQVARELVSLIKKRVVIRSDPSIRKPQEEAAEVIKSKISHSSNLFFDETLGEAIIETNDMTATISESDEVAMEIMKLTGWKPRVVRSPLMTSRTFERLRNYVYWDPREKLEILRNVGERIFRAQTFTTEDVTVTFLGAARQVGRSAMLVETSESRVLLDCGLAPGASSSIDMFPRFDSRIDEIMNLDAVVISHAHLDHMGVLPFLFKYGYRGPVFLLEPTLALMTMEQIDYIGVAAKEGSFAPYSEQEVRTQIQHTIPLRYGTVSNITPDIRITLYNAGHILGSSIVHLHVGEGLHNIVYTGDYKFERSRTLEPSVYKFPRAETLIMEATYGANPVPFTRVESEAILAGFVKQAVERGGKILIPVAAIGRAQEIMLVVKALFEQKFIPEVPVFLDGLLIEATALHTAYPEYLSQELRMAFDQNLNAFASDLFTPVKNQTQRDEILNSQGSAVIMSTSGMLEGGPVLGYLKEFANDEKNMLIFVMYQVEGTMGRKLLKGIREIPLADGNGKTEIIQIKLQVERVDGFSGHSSRQQLLNYLRRFTPKPRNLVLIHGEPEAIDSLAKTASRIIPSRIYAPRCLDSLSLTS